MKKSTIIFVSALQEEMDPLWSDPRFKWSAPLEDGDSIWYRKCDYGDYQFISAAACEMGLVASAILTTKLVLKWKPVLIIALGICAGRKGFMLGDVIISSAAFLYRFGRHIDGEFISDERCQNLDVRMLKIVEDLARRWPKVASEIFKNRKSSPKTMLGAYASADFVLKDANVMQTAANLHPEFYAVDMESFAIFRAAEILDVPYGAVIVKAISDHGDEFKTDEGRSFVKSVSKEVAIQLATSFTNVVKEVSIPAIFEFTNEAVSEMRDNRLPIIAFCPQQNTFEKMRQKIGSHNTVVEKFREDVLKICMSEDRKLIVTTVPKGHYGHVDAAIWSSVFIKSFKPSLVLLVGSCGGFSKETQLGDLIVANRGFHFQFGSYKSGQLYPEIKSIDIHDGVRGFLFAYSHGNLDDLLEAIYENYSPSDPKAKPTRQPTWHIDPLASSDLYLCDGDKVKEAIEQDRKVIGVEMEGYAVMRAAKHASVPLGTIIVRSVADYADKQSTHHLEFAELLSVEAAVHLLNNGVRDLVTRYASASGVSSRYEDK